MADPIPQQAGFQLEEATIDELHAAIKSGTTTVVAVTQHCLARVRGFSAAPGPAPLQPERRSGL
jgi:hypothetical protein